MPISESAVALRKSVCHPGNAGSVTNTAHGDWAGFLVLRVLAIKSLGPWDKSGRGSFHVRPAWASTWRWESSRELVTASEANRRASFREAGVKEAGSETAGRRTGTG